MTVPQADGRTEVTLHGPGLQNTLQTVALRGPACASNKRKRRRKPNTRRKPKNGNTARRRAPRANPKSIMCQKVKGQCLQEGSPDDLALLLVLLQVTIILRLGEDAGPQHLIETRDPTLDPTHTVDRDLGGDPGLIHDPEVFLDQEVTPCLDPDLRPILDPDQDQGPGTDPGLCLHLDREVHPDPKEKEKTARASQMSWSMGQRNFLRAK